MSCGDDLDRFPFSFRRNNVANEDCVYDIGRWSLRGVILVSDVMSHIFWVTMA